MTVKTVITYQPAAGPTARDIIQAQCEIWASQGKTDGVKTTEDILPNGVIITRHWTTLADAEEYVAFVTPYNPTNIEITE